MTTLTRTLTAGLGVLLLSTIAFAQDRAADREAINELMWRYARALDSFNPDAYAALYTEDGQFIAGGNATRGREALWQMIEDLRSRRETQAAEGNPAAPLYHMTTDAWTEFVDETHAMHHTYWLTVSGGNPVSILAAGRGVDHLLKVNGRWLIETRDVTPGD
jgi:uncharacterized protein (TIGR02246 family)